MSLNIALVGLPNVGKSTLFNALTEQNVLVADYPFATIKPNIGIVPLPDTRVEHLGQIFQSAKIVPASVSFTDIAGLVQGASQGAGLGNKFLAEIRTRKVIAQVVEVFRQPEKIGGQMEIIQTELILADWQTLTKETEKLKKVAKSQDEAAEIYQACQKALIDLDQYIPLNESPHKELYHETLGSFHLFTLKPLIYIFNLAEDDLKNAGLQQNLQKLAGNKEYLFLSAKLELELSQLPAAETQAFLLEYGLKERGINQLARLGFKILGLQTFLTAGPKETKAWVIPQNCLAPKAAGIIHTDMERGFIAADIVNFEDLASLKSVAAAKAAGVLRTEGKNYMMQDGDVVEFKFNV